jgi:RHS repeat-associated protein
MSINGRGQVLLGMRGNGTAASTYYNNGLPVRFQTAGVQDYVLKYDYQTGNVLGRYDNVKGLNETFQYDNLNRLTYAAAGSNILSYPAQTVTYTASPNSNGNITNKSDVGNYRYFGPTVHGVSYIDNAAGNIPLATQDVTYTPFLKPETIKENNWEQRLYYGHDYERRKTELYNGPALQETRYYLGEGAELHIDAATAASRYVYYIPGPDGLAAIIHRLNGVETVYYPYTDQLGSILSLTDATGAVVYEQAFDAWGLYRDPATWAAYDGTYTPPQWDWLRGFTGHEHMPHFRAINMNGRVYDPLVARMFSPDMYVQDGLLSQHYNRFSYAYNNPLTYIDPDGNNPILIAMAIGAIIGAYSGGVAANGGQYNPGKWDYRSDRTWSYMA